MRVFISYSHQDAKYANVIITALKAANHDVWYDRGKLKTGDNLITKLNEGIKSSDAFILIISKYSLRSKWVKHEYSTLALGDISSERTRVIPVLVDKSSVPQYLANHLYVDMSMGVERGVDKILSALAETDKQKTRKVQPKRTRDYTESISKLNRALREGRLTLVCGAGVSIGAGIPSWNDLLIGLLEKMMAQLSDTNAISIKGVNAKDFYEKYGGSALILGKYLKSNLGVDFASELRDALYINNPTSCDIIDSIIELSRPQRDGMPLDSLITFNFDDLIEEVLSANKIRHKSIHDEGMKNESSELPIFHVHGFLPRKGKIPKDREIVFSEDAYHGQFIDPFSWSNLIQLNKLSQNTCFFIGLSLTDPNLRRLLDVANRKNPGKAMNHYLIKKTPGPIVKGKKTDDLAYFLEEQDANELGLNIIWVDNFSDIAPIIKSIMSKV